jgi:hypothetical protein
MIAQIHSYNIYIYIQLWGFEPAPGRTPLYGTAPSNEMSATLTTALVLPSQTSCRISADIGTVISEHMT